MAGPSKALALAQSTSATYDQATVPKIRARSQANLELLVVASKLRHQHKQLNILRSNTLRPRRRKVRSRTTRNISDFGPIRVKWWPLLAKPDRKACRLPPHLSSWSNPSSGHEHLPLNTASSHSSEQDAELRCQVCQDLEEML